MPADVQIKGYWVESCNWWSISSKSLPALSIAVMPAFWARSIVSLSSMWQCESVYICFLFFLVYLLLFNYRFIIFRLGQSRLLNSGFKMYRLLELW